MFQPYMCCLLGHTKTQFFNGHTQQHLWYQ